MVSEIGADRPAHERRRQDAYRVIFESAEDPIFIHDPDSGAILDANPRACDLLGYNQAQIRQASVEDFSTGIPPFDQAHALALIQAARFQPQRAEWPLRASDGRILWHEIVLRLISLNGRDRVLAVGRDITDRKAEDSARQQLESELRQAHKLEAIGAVSGGIAADFERILTAISGNLSMVSRRTQAMNDSELHEWLREAAQVADQGRVLIDRLLTYSRGQRGETTDVQLAPIVRQTVDELRERFTDGAQLHFDLPQKLPPVHFNPVQGAQVVFNLCANAADSLGPEGRVSFSLRALSSATRVCSSCNRRIEGAYVVLCVSDNGQGIDTDCLQRVFDPFFTTRSRGRNSGLGLSIVHGLVHEHGGHIVINSAPDVGTEVEVFFPIAAARSAPEAACQLQGRAMVVGNSELTWKICGLLKGWGLQAHNIDDLETDGSEQMAEAGCFDFAVLDLDPEQGTAGLLRQIEALGNRAPVLVCASDARADAAIADRPQVAVLRKPVDADKLRMYVEALLDHPE